MIFSGYLFSADVLETILANAVLEAIESGEIELQ